MYKFRKDTFSTWVSGFKKSYWVLRNHRVFSRIPVLVLAWCLCDHRLRKALLECILCKFVNWRRIRIWWERIAYIVYWIWLSVDRYRCPIQAVSGRQDGRSWSGGYDGFKNLASSEEGTTFCRDGFIVNVIGRSHLLVLLIQDAIVLFSNTLLSKLPIAVSLVC